jgi:3'(2'), 5'-bisphosphate nucleotidase
MSSKLANELEVAIHAVKRAAVVCRSIQSSISDDVMEKKDKSPVTVADFASQAVICKALMEQFPADPVIGEEDSKELQTEDSKPFVERILREISQVGIEGSAGDLFEWIDRGDAKDHSDRFWTLDPIDGTKGFLRGEQYAVALALIIDGEVELALLGCPNLKLDEETTGVIQYAIKGEGSFQVPLDSDEPPRQLKISSVENASEARFCESVESGHSSHSLSAKVAETLGITKEPIRLDSQAKYAVVGRGDADIYMRLPTRPGYREKIWDHAGGVLIVQEAGGIVSDIEGKPLEFNHGFELVKNAGILAANPKFYPGVLQALKEHDPRKKQ